MSQYGKDVSWTKRLGCPVLVYTKGQPGEHSVPRNKGREASAYLKFIVDYYDRLPERTIFLHDEEYSWHHVGSIVDLAQESIVQPGSYRNLNSIVLDSIQDMVNCNDDEELKWLAQRNISDPQHWWKEITQWFDAYLGPYLGNHQQHGDWTTGHLGCAQILVHRDLIRQHPVEMYRVLYDWILSTDLPCSKTSRFLEWTWHLIFQRGEGRTSIVSGNDDD